MNTRISPEAAIAPLCRPESKPGTSSKIYRILCFGDAANARVTTSFVESSEALSTTITSKVSAARLCCANEARQDASSEDRFLVGMITLVLNDMNFLPTALDTRGRHRTVEPGKLHRVPQVKPISR